MSPRQHLSCSMGALCADTESKPFNGATAIEMGIHTRHLTESMARRTPAQFNSAAKKRLAAREQGRGD